MAMSPPLSWLQLPPQAVMVFWTVVLQFGAVLACAGTQGAAKGSGCAEAPKVEVVLVAEAGCPFCQDAILGQLNDLVNSPGLADVIELVYHPFGNNYYATPTCGGAPYQKEIRECWTKMCVMVPTPPLECFDGDIVTQHGPLEAQVNRMEACAKKYAATWQVLWPFLVCMEKEYSIQGIQAFKGCTAETVLDYSQLESCYNNIEGDQALIAEATTSIKHSSVPYITVNGRPIKKEGVLAEVCTAYSGPQPRGCAQGAPGTAKPTLAPEPEGGSFWWSPHWI